jgi:dienelactone hydrolase
MPTAVTAAQEEPVFFPAAGESLFGIHTRPKGTRRGIGVVIAQGGDTVNVSFQRNRLAVRLARQLADDGYDVIRFDWHGIGESTGTIDVFHLDIPFVADVRGAADYLRGEGVDRFVVVGACYGARTVISSAPHIEGVVGVVAATPPTGSNARGEMGERWARDRTVGSAVRAGLRPERLKGWFDARSRRHYLRLMKGMWRRVTRRFQKGYDGDFTSPKFSEPMLELTKRGVPVLICWGDDDPMINDFRRTQQGRLQKMFATSATVTVLDDLPGELHGFLTIPGQERFLDVVTEWMRHQVAGEAS